MRPKLCPKPQSVWDNAVWDQVSQTLFRLCSPFGISVPNYLTTRSFCGFFACSVISASVVSVRLFACLE